MIRLLVLCAIAAIDLSSGSDRVAAPAPPMRERVVGSWEGIGEDDLRIFRMEIASRDADSVVAMTAGRLKPVTLLFRATRVYARDGRFELDATGIDGPDDLRIRGSIKRIAFTSSEGLVEAKVMLVGKASRLVNSWQVSFLNYGGDYLHRLSQLSADAIARIHAAQRAGTTDGRPD